MVANGWRAQEIDWLRERLQTALDDNKRMAEMIGKLEAEIDRLLAAVEAAETIITGG